MSIPCNLILKPGEADRLLAGHPWIYEKSIHKITHPANDGDVVQVKDHKTRFIGIGFFNTRSRIRFRMLSRERREIDQRFFEERIRAALAVRKRNLPNATSFRVVNSESDFLSGLIVDKYNDVLVLQASSLGMDQRKPMICAALKKIFSPQAIVERSDGASRKFEGLESSSGIVSGDLPETVTITLNDLQFETDLLNGHKTGMYLDQQTNYRQVAELISHYANPRVLDCFTFSGGFAIHAARAGAQVLAIDQSEEAVAAAKRNAGLNQISERCTFESANVFDWLKAHTAKSETQHIEPFDCIILDPPSFTRNRASVPDALRGYKEIHLRALKLLKPGGMLATFCCSHHVDSNLFESVILDAAFDTRKQLRRIASFSQSLDHPIIPSIPETEYLKGFAFELAE